MSNLSKLKPKASKKESNSFDLFVKDHLPDVSLESEVTVGGTLNSVGMRGIEMPVLIDHFQGEKFYQKAKIDAFVSLDNKKAKGIHMSRLYLALQEELQGEVLNEKLIHRLLSRFIKSQGHLSRSSFLKIEFDLPILQTSLKSGKESWKYYPSLFEGSLKSPTKKGNLKGVKEFEFSIGSRVMYSSTCPCSAALSRQITQQKFLKDFKGEKTIPLNKVLDWLSKPIPATPHAQRSFIQFKVKLSEKAFSYPLSTLIDQVEKSLGTPVQTLVKREDEQEFAKRNASNLMFCEDAARKVKFLFEEKSYIKDYMISVDHVESLHPHSASSFSVKGVDGGFS